MSQIRILIVDDHPVVRHGLESLLAGHPDLVVVGTAEDGAQVLPLLAGQPVDVILLDIQMRGQSGIDVARRVRQSHPHVKIIILTTYDDESYLHQALAAGVDGYLLKSASHKTLPDSIRAISRGDKLLSSSLVSSVVTEFQRLAEEHARREAGLTADDLKILRAIADGAGNKEIAGQLFISEATLKRRVQEILEKLGAGNRAQAIAEAMRQGWI
jgi:two-component system, NarL family, response regulator DevR